MRSPALFVAWGVVGFLAGFLLLYGFTPLGAPIWVVALLALLYLPRVAGRREPEIYGALAGFGAFWLFIASSVDGDATVFILPGVFGAAVGTLAYLAAGRRRCRRALG